MKRRPDKQVAAVAVFLILVCPGALSARERRGANLDITLKDGHHVMGELIAVKPDSLLLLNLAGYDRSIDLVAIKSIRIVKESKAGPGALYGFLAGALGGAVAGYSYGKGQDHYPEMYAFLGGLVFGAAGGLIGLALGDLSGSDETIELEGKSESAIKSNLAGLRGKARIRDYK